MKKHKFPLIIKNRNSIFNNQREPTAQISHIDISIQSAYKHHL